MSSLVLTFERKLHCLHEEAFWRVIGLFFFPAIAVGIIVVMATSPYTFFPHRSGYTQHIPILPGDHVQVSKISLKEKAQVETRVEREEFLRLTEGNQTFMLIEDDAITYMVNRDGVSSLYVQPAGYDFVRYRLSSYDIQDNVMVREIKRDTFGTVFMFVAAPAMVLFVLLFLAWRMTWKEYGQAGKSKSLFDER